MKPKHPLVIAHRGASARAPENTLAAIRAAWVDGADAVEVDLRLTSDGVPVALHDPDFRRTAGDPRRVAETDLAEVGKLDAGRWAGEAFRGERVPALSEILAEVPDGKRLVLELKTGVELVAAVASELVRAAFDPSRTDVIAFDLEVVAAAKRALPGAACLWLADALPDGIDPVARSVREHRLDGVDIAVGAAGAPGVVEGFLAEGMRVYTYTVNSPDAAVRLAGRGIGGITTDHPTAVGDALAAKGFR